MPHKLEELKLLQVESEPAVKSQSTLHVKHLTKLLQKSRFQKPRKKVLRQKK